MGVLQETSWEEILQDATRGTSIYATERRGNTVLMWLKAIASKTNNAYPNGRTVYMLVELSRIKHFIDQTFHMETNVSWHYSMVLKEEFALLVLKGNYKREITGTDFCTAKNKNDWIPEELWVNH